MWLDLSRGQILKDAQSIKKLRSIFWSKLLQKNCLAGPFFTDADVIQVNLLTDFFLNHAKIGAKNSIQHPIIRSKLYFFGDQNLYYIALWCKNLTKNDIRLVQGLYNQYRCLIELFWHFMMKTIIFEVTLNMHGKLSSLSYWKLFRLVPIQQRLFPSLFFHPMMYQNFGRVSVFEVPKSSKWGKDSLLKWH